MIGICFLTCLAFFPASCHLIGDIGPPLELMAGDIGGGHEDYLFPDVETCELFSELQSENLDVELNLKETHTFDLTLRIDGQLPPSHLVKVETAFVGPEILLPGQHLTCTAETNEVVEIFVDAVADVEGKVISTITDGKLSRLFILQWRYMDILYALEPRASELTGCHDMQGAAMSLLKGTFLLQGQVHYLFDVTRAERDDSGSSGAPSPTSQTASTTTTQQVSTLAQTTSPMNPITTSTNRPPVTPPPPPPTNFFIILCVVVASSFLLMLVAMVFCCRECRKRKQCKETTGKEKKSKEGEETPVKR